MHVLLERQCYEDERWRSSIVGRKGQTNDCEPYRLAWGCCSASFLDGRTPNWKLIQYRLYTGRSNDKWWSTLELPAASMKVQQPIVKTVPIVHWALANQCRALSSPSRDQVQLKRKSFFFSLSTGVGHFSVVVGFFVAACDPSSVHDGIQALGKAHTRSIQSLQKFPRCYLGTPPKTW